ncbi:MAG: thiamine-phosphate kinase, partial [Gammaproteobacteria bacterium]|nr:thiamine-phosphate kinase [Gammaproteobacteria bacterium]
YYGEDYELCFPAPAQCREVIQALSKKLNLPLSCIGHITPGPLFLLDQKPLEIKGYQHFR